MKILEKRDYLVIGNNFDREKIFVTLRSADTSYIFKLVFSKYENKTNRNAMTWRLEFQDPSKMFSCFHRHKNRLGTAIPNILLSNNHWDYLNSSMC